MKLKLGAAALVVFAFAALAIAQNAVDGKWAGEVQGGRGPQQITVTLKVDGSTLTGSVAGGRGGEIAIKDGAISGTTINFKTTQMGRGGNEVTFKWSGTLKGDEIAMTRSIESGQGQPQEFTLKRQK
jgi:hypothetical protein